MQNFFMNKSAILARTSLGFNHLENQTLASILTSNKYTTHKSSETVGVKLYDGSEATLEVIQYIITDSEGFSSYNAYGRVNGNDRLYAITGVADLTAHAGDEYTQEQMIDYLTSFKWLHDIDKNRHYGTFEGSVPVPFYGSDDLIDLCMIDMAIDHYSKAYNECRNENEQQTTLNVVAEILNRYTNKNFVERQLYLGGEGHYTPSIDDLYSIEDVMNEIVNEWFAEDLSLAIDMTGELLQFTALSSPGVVITPMYKTRDSDDVVDGGVYSSIIEVKIGNKQHMMALNMFYNSWDSSTFELELVEETQISVTCYKEVSSNNTYIKPISKHDIVVLG